jgi:TRAP-type mannitol/chloroaromatic compound transport system permease large subunit
VASTEDELQRAAYTLNNIAIKYNLKFSVNNTKPMAMKGKMNTRTTTVINNNIIIQVNSFNYLGYTITVSNIRDLEIKRNRFNQMCSLIRRILNNKTRKDTPMKFRKSIVVPTLAYGSEL